MRQSSPEVLGRTPTGAVSEADDDLWEFYAYGSADGGDDNQYQYYGDLDDEVNADSYSNKNIGQHDVTTADIDDLVVEPGLGLRTLGHIDAATATPRFRGNPTSASQTP